VAMVMIAINFALSQDAVAVENKLRKGRKPVVKAPDQQVAVPAL
jgi:hypothetical protein